MLEMQFLVPLNVMCNNGIENDNLEHGTLGADLHEAVAEVEAKTRTEDESAEACDVESGEGAPKEDDSDYSDVFGMTKGKFGRCHGFGVRKGDYGKDVEGKLIRRRFFCNRTSLRDEKHYLREDRKRAIGQRPGSTVRLFYQFT
ncbi:hypothetical protein PIB30_069978 [Stylosanthes scabra]|uniref:FAR1 domain-containing protein n=1 Tax=Stylosanthes scabra TaxID=79078 RepID=A0ABU6VNK3_9FABA|nr:hypothetical protein [Stylosanthes scabra]